MLLSTLIIVLRETLEAALVISLLLVFSRLHGMATRWVWYGLGAGVIGAVVYASQITLVSELFDYTGQEITNASMQAAIFASLVIFTVLICRPAQRQGPRWSAQVSALMAAVIALAVAREGFEILLYLSGLMTKPELVTPLLLGTTLGAGIGCSIGALFYYGLLSFAPRTSQPIALLLLALFGGNMLSQAAQMLIQADLLPGGATLWDSSRLLAEDSLAGQLFYALIGYEATPTLTQFSAYLGGFGTLLLIAIAGTARQRVQAG